MVEKAGVMHLRLRGLTEEVALLRKENARLLTELERLARIADQRLQGGRSGSPATPDNDQETPDSAGDRTL